MTNIDNEAEAGHYVNADFQKLDKSGIPIIGEKYEDRFFQLIENNEKDSELTKQLIGIKAGESRRVQLTSIDPQTQQQVFDNY